MLSTLQMVATNSEDSRCVRAYQGCRKTGFLIWVYFGLKKHTKEYICIRTYIYS